MAARYEPSVEPKPTGGGRKTSVTFQPRVSVYSSVSGITQPEYWYFPRDPATDEGDEVRATLDAGRWWMWRIMKSNKARQSFRVLSFANLFVLALSLPFSDDVEVLKVQYSIITVLDAILALLFTCQLVLRIIYLISQPYEERAQCCYDCVRFMSLTGVFISVWYSVVIGVYRSVVIEIYWAWYIGFLPRAILSVTSAAKLFRRLKIESTVLQKVSTIIKWKQLCMVTVFYFIFVFIFALLGVHIIGRLDRICVYNGSVPAVPITHCNPTTSLFCPDGDEYDITCGNLSDVFNISDGLFLNYRTYVYYGQFWTILDGLYAVYEASTLELWSFMMTSAMEGHSGETGRLFAISVFYMVLILFIVILLQQSIFLVVIIESFADLRSHSRGKTSSSSSSSSNQKQQPTKPSTVLSLDGGVLRLKSTEKTSPQEFINRYKGILLKMEKIFLALVLLDSIITSLKMADFNKNKDIWRIFLQTWQFTVSTAFLIEVIILFTFHLYHGQLKLFFKRPYYVCLIVLATGGIIAAIPLKYFYNPLYPSNGFIIFQALRFPRLIRLSRHLREFFHKLMANARIPILIVITVAIIVFLSIINAQIFTYQKYKCSVAEGHYNNFIEAFLSTFQLVMNEAWTDITSDLMCKSSYWWLLTNFYFIVIHLFSSLIFLNFFGAVILDNLEYDEDEKRRKLEDIKRKKANAETVPFHLRIFKILNNQPKMLRPPGKGLPDPNLEEVEVRRFFESANTSGVSSSTDHCCYNEPQPKPKQRSTQLKSVSLVTDVDDDFNMFIPNYERRYQTVDALLKFVKHWRHKAEEKDTGNTRSSQLPYLFGESTRNQGNKTMNRSEFDEFREKHRCFDLALFCLSPENKLRKFCTLLLTAQIQTPKQELIEGKLWVLFKARAVFLIKWILSQMPFSTWIMFITLWFTIIIQFYELTALIFGSKNEHSYIVGTEVLYVFVMLAWLLIKVLSKGCFLNPHAAISSVFDVLDWIFLIDSFILLVTVPLWGIDLMQNGIVMFGSFSTLHGHGWVSVLMSIRALRPLHIISLFRSLRSVVGETIEGWRNLLTAFIIMAGFMFMFASLGVQLFAGTEDNPLAFCNDPAKTSKSECVGEFNISVKVAKEFLQIPSVTREYFILVPRVWFPYARDFPFNNVLYAFITLFELLTLEGWIEVRDMFRDERSSLYMKFYIHIYVFLAVNLGLQLFLGIVVNNFNEHKPGHRFLLSIDQNRWVELMQRISLQRPYKLPKEPRHNIFRLKLYNFVTHNQYRIIPTIFTVLSTLTLVVPWDLDNIGSLIVLNVIFNYYIIIEVIMKFLAFGPLYFHSRRNLFDLFLALAIVLYSIFVIIFFNTKRPSLSYVALTISILKCLKAMLQYSAMLNLLITIGNTVMRTIPLLLVLMIIILCYSFLGVILFSDIMKGEGVSYSVFNFGGALQAFASMWRCLTGEDWYQIMWDVALRDPYGFHDGGRYESIIVSVLYFGSFIVVVPFILLNVFIAVLLENFSIFYNDDDTKLSLSVIKDFKRKWRYFDTQAKGHIKLSRIKLLLRTLELQDFYSYNLGDPNQSIGRIKCHLTEDSLLLWEMEEELRREVSQSVKKTTPTSQNPESDAIVSFQDVLRMLAYRCEDIHTRLESHELYTRQELETTIQIDVAEMCILKWLKKYVKPIVDWNRDQSSAETSTVRESVSHDRQYQLFAIHNMHSQLLREGWQLGAEDEERQTRQPYFPTLDEISSEDNDEESGQNDEENNDDNGEEVDDVVARTYAKMMQNRNPELEEGRKKAAQWLQMQYQWMDNVGRNPNYFDDCL